MPVERASVRRGNEEFCQWNLNQWEESWFSLLLLQPMRKLQAHLATRVDSVWWDASVESTAELCIFTPGEICQTRGADKGNGRTRREEPMRALLKLTEIESQWENWFDFRLRESVILATGIHDVLRHFQAAPSNDEAAWEMEKRTGMIMMMICGRQANIDNWQDRCEEVLWSFARGDYRCW